MFGKHSVPVFAALICLLVVSAAPAWGQSSNTGTIIGSVFDNSNAFVPGATVTVTQTNTGSMRTTLTDKSGRFVFADVDPGTYSIKVTKQGFSSAVIADQVVQLGLQLTENIKLEVGSISTTVTVTETPGAELQTMTPTVGTTLSGEIIINLPNTSRDASTLAIFQPGQNILGNTGGLESDQNSFQLDGGFATDDMSGDNNTYIHSFGSDTAGGAGAMHSAGFNQTPSAVVPIPVASIEEFKVSTANQTADFNGGGGSQVQLVTKRGTNAFHGSAYDYYEDSVFGGANTWDNNDTGNPIVSSHFSRFGGAAGGKIPHSDFLGGSWFIFGNYEGFHYPQGSTFEEQFPLPSMRAGIIHLDGQTINLNPFPVVDPGCGAATAGCGLTAANGYTQVGASVPTTICPAGPCDPRALGTTTNGAAGGPANPVIALWNTYVPLPNDCTQGDGINYCGYKGTIATPQSSNFGVARIDHDFAAKWHFNSTYHYYNLVNTVSDQWDVGGFFPGDTLGDYAAIRHKPQVPWIITAGLTTEVSSNVTNDFHVSYTRNYWAYEGPGGPPNVAGYPAALEIGGETSGSYQPYNTNNQNVRTRFWDGKDTMFRDDVTWIKGNHLFQFGGTYQRNNDTHTRNDNGGTINTFEQYLVGDGNGTPLAAFGIDMTGYVPTGVSANKYGNLYSMILGMVDETQSLYTHSLGSLTTGLPLSPRGSCAIAGIAATADCIGSPPLTNDSLIPYYNVYFTDSWHIKPTFSLNYGVGYTIEMPPYELNGGVQTVMVDQNDNIFNSQQFLNSVKTAALQGQAYAPEIGFATVRNVQFHSKYPYNPYYGGVSPRIGFAWNPKSDTVIRGGYARIFGRINGVNPVLVPMLTPGLMQPATCGGPNITTGGCGGTTPLNNFRAGVDCPASGPCFAPLPAPSAFLPQPWYPGVNQVATGAGETIDPNFKPDRSDEFTFSVQHQFGPKVLAEGGYIGRKLASEVQYYSLTAVPYMMTQGGQTFANAWKTVMVNTNYGTTNLPNTTANTSAVPTQPFFETALGGKPGAFNPGGYCYNATAGAPFPNCTAAFVANNDYTTGNALMTFDDPFDVWGGISNNNSFNFGRTFTNDPIPSSAFGANGQSPSITTTISNGYGNYNAGYLQLTFQNWHGFTAKTNFTMAKTLGTGNVVQASSSFADLDPWNPAANYGLQSYDEKFTFNLFMSYAEPFFSSQQGVVGRILGGWTFSPLFVAGGGFPIEINTPNFDCGSLGECNTAYVGSFENGVITQPLNYSASLKASTGGTDSATGVSCGVDGPGFNVFSNPLASCPTQIPGAGIFGDPVRAPILGLDEKVGGFPLRGLPFWNLDLGITKKIRVNEKLSSSLYFDFTNVLNHMQPADPSFNMYDQTSWGVLGGGGNLQGNTPRRFQVGLSVDW
jgi:hypothetical protein